MPHNGTLTTQTPAGASDTRPVPPSWASVAPLLERWQMALAPWRDGRWDVLAGWPHGSGLPRLDIHYVPFAELPAAIARLAAQCEREGAGKGEA